MKDLIEGDNGRRDIAASALDGNAQVLVEVDTSVGLLEEGLNIIDDVARASLDGSTSLTERELGVVVSGGRRVVVTRGGAIGRATTTTIAASTTAVAASTTAIAASTATGRGAAV